MEKNTENVLVRNVNVESKRKAMFVLKCKGKDLSTGIREMIDKLAKEFDETQGKGGVTNG